MYLFDLIDLIDLFNLFDLFDLFDLIEWATHRLDGAAGDAAAPLARQIAQGARAATYVGVGTLIIRAREGEGEGKVRDCECECENPPLYFTQSSAVRRAWTETIFHIKEH